MNPEKIEKRPLNEVVLQNYLKMKGIDWKNADLVYISEDLSATFTNCDPERISEMLERIDCPIVYFKNASSIDFERTPPIHYYIDGLLSEGLSMITAPPKGGKSRLMLQMALAISEGKTFLGRSCRKCGVLYLALEDERIDFENRLQAFLQGASAPDCLYYATLEDFDFRIPSLERGQLIPLLEENIKQHPGIKVILIDVFGAIRSRREKNEDFTMHERRDLQTVLRFLGKHPGIAVVIAHHVSKTGKRLGNLEAIGSGAGSYVISGTIHSEMLLTKGDRENERIFSVEGRRIPAQKFMLLDDFPQWKYAGSKEDYERENNPLYLTIERILQENQGVWQGTLAQIEERNRIYEDIPNITRSLKRETFSHTVLNDLQVKGIAYKLIKNGKGYIHQFKNR